MLPSSHRRKILGSSPVTRFGAVQRDSDDRTLDAAGELGEGSPGWIGREGLQPALQKGGRQRSVNEGT